MGEGNIIQLKVPVKGKIQGLAILDVKVLLSLFVLEFVE